MEVDTVECPTKIVIFAEGSRFRSSVAMSTFFLNGCLTRRFRFLFVRRWPFSCCQARADFLVWPRRIGAARIETFCSASSFAFVIFWPKEKSPTKSRTGRNTNNGTDTNWKRRTFRLALQLVELPAASRDFLGRRAPKSSKWPRRFVGVGPAMCFGGFSRSFLHPLVKNEDGTYGSHLFDYYIARRRRNQRAVSWLQQNWKLSGNDAK